MLRGHNQGLIGFEAPFVIQFEVIVVRQCRECHMTTFGSFGRRFASMHITALPTYQRCIVVVEVVGENVGTVHRQNQLGIVVRANDRFGKCRVQRQKVIYRHVCQLCSQADINRFVEFDCGEIGLIRNIL